MKSYSKEIYEEIKLLRGSRSLPRRVRVQFSNKCFNGKEKLILTEYIEDLITTWKQSKYFEKENNLFSTLAVWQKERFLTGF